MPRAPLLCFYFQQTSAFPEQIVHFTFSFRTSSKQLRLTQKNFNSVSFVASTSITTEISFSPLWSIYVSIGFHFVSLVQQWPINSITVLHIDKLLHEPCTHQITFELFWCYFMAIHLNSQHPWKTTKIKLRTLEDWEKFIKQATIMKKN